MSAGDLRLYDPDQVLITVAGIPMTGFADGEFCRIEYDNDAFADVVGTDGEVTRMKSNDGRATVTIKLMQSSPVNALLSVLHTSDRNAPGGVGVGAFSLQDLANPTGGTLLVGEKCWIAKPPDSSWDRTATEREWKIRVAKLDGLDGGSVQG